MGHSNLYAECAGVLVIDKGVVDRINAVDEAIIAATLPAYKPGPARRLYTSSMSNTWTSAARISLSATRSKSVSKLWHGQQCESGAAHRSTRCDDNERGRAAPDVLQAHCSSQRQRA